MVVAETILLPILPGTLPPNACYPNEQARLNAFAANMQAQLNGQSFYNYGSTEPSIENRSYPWIRTTDMRIYEFVGRWRSPVNYDENERRLWIGTLSALETYDGGEVGSPMWMEDEAFRGRAPVGPGPLPGSDPAVTLGYAEDIGAASHLITLDEMPEHSHEVRYGNDDSGEGFPTTGNDDSFEFSYNTMPKGGDTPISMMQPSRGIYIIKWNTARPYRYAS